ILQPEAGCATNYKEAFNEATRIGYPVLVRPSYVLGGRAMEIVYDDRDLERYLKEAVKVSNEHPVLIDDFLDNAVEIDVDAICDGREILIGAIMEHIEEAGIHSGDSACVIPSQSLKPEIIATVRDYVKKIALALHVVGIVNIQMATKNGLVYVLEANPRSSRTIPFVSKAVGLPLAKIAAKVMAGHTLKELGYTGDIIPKHVSVKEVLLPFDKLPGADPVLGPEMKSTGEVMGIDYDFGRAFFKAEWAADNTLPLSGTVVMSVRDEDKKHIIGVAKKMQDAGLHILGTRGTVRYLEKNGIKIDVINKVSEGTPNIVDLIHKKKVDLIINTPTSKQTVKDGFQIRRAAVDFSVPYITTIQAALAAADAIQTMKNGEITIKSLGEYHAKS
ncbi:MAG: ATP-grasp domain-containing protein, partial [Candidatus Methanoperedens sp.]|nr:ATP-grasp domain-containing protein [Candidatus Methanoperedens sp.]